MEQSKHDAETQQVLAEAATLEALFTQPGWTIFLRIYNGYIDTLDKVSTIDPKEDMNQQLRDRINTVATLRAIMSDVEGRVKNAQAFATMKPAQDPLIVRRQ